MYGDLPIDVTMHNNIKLTITDTYKKCILKKVPKALGLGLPGRHYLGWKVFQ